LLGVAVAVALTFLLKETGKASAAVVLPFKKAA